MTIQLILFDIDGTLLLPKGAGRAATKLALLELFGTDAGIDGHDFGGKTDWRTLVELLAPHGHSDADIQQIMPRYEQIVARHLSQIIGGFPVTPCVGALELVHQLREQNRRTLGILTGNVSRTAPIKLRAAGFDPAWFPVGAYGSEASDRNDLPFLALERAQGYLGKAIQPEQVMIIGDTPADVACARALGAVAVAVLTGFSSRATLAATEPDYLLDDLTTFPDTVAL